ncbi:non-contractile tail fiber protein [Salmonella phage vB_SalS_PC192]|uniref:Non-contractile tail fiber protein n=1 Tax=Salmonella phage vB_SalM_PC127 TaxID=2961705 RepID=A0A9E7NZ50_9CAUD|nr:non-contractile tail fiber protein [Salmonella phage vB_SalM_PC127]UVK80566.1 non-contractile tail fiber protein [Salmonella phage vB_SalS_PC192]
MALKIRTVMTYPLTGAVNFAITFEYLARKFVTVTLIGKDRKELVLNQDYRFTTKTQITTTRTWTAADGYDSIEIRRYTSATDRLVDFADGSILRAYDLNIAQIQTLHVAEEARDLTADTIGVNNDGHLDARGRRIVNVADAKDDFDAVNLNQVKRWDGSALNSANRAAASEQNALTYRNDAERFKNEANSFRDSAETSKNLAQTADQQAYGHRVVAEEAARNSENSFQAALSSRNDAERFKNEANGFRDAAESAAGTAQKYGDKVLEGMATFGSLPVGAVVMFLRGTPPPGFLECGVPFDVKAYPALAKLFPEGVTPTFHNRFPRGYANNPQAHETGKGQYGEQNMPAHNHELRATGRTADAGGGRFWGSGAGAHKHDVSISYRNNSGSYQHAGYVRLGSNGTYDGVDTYGTSWVDEHNHYTDIPNHAHDVTVTGNTLGNGGQIGAGHSHITPYNVGVMFCIKAYESIDELDQATFVGRAENLEARALAAENRVATLERYRKAVKVLEAPDVEFATDRIEIVQYSDMSRILSNLGDYIPTGTTRCTVALTLDIHNPGIAIHNQRATAIAELMSGTDDGRLVWLPTSSMGHAINANNIELGVQYKPAEQGGDPYLVFRINKGATLISRGSYSLWASVIHYF